MKRLAYALLMTALLVTLIAACTANEPASSESLDGKALAETQCAVCHPYSRVEQAKKSPADWRSNVERMVAKGAKLNEAEQAAVIEHLSGAFPE